MQPFTPHGEGEDDRPAKEAEAAEADALAPLASPKGMERVRAMAMRMSRNCPGNAQTMSRKMGKL